MKNHQIKANIEAEVGQIVASEDIKYQVKEWLEKAGDDAEKLILLWVSGETGMLHSFGSNMKCGEAIGYLEIAKSDLIDYMYEDEGEKEDSS